MVFSCLFVSTTIVPTVFAQPLASDALADLSLEELADLQITSVSRREESLSNAPASIFVITAEDIRRSGATTLPEVLRLAPNLQVASIDSVQSAITARGFNNAIGNKLLVLIDGRTIYTPLFSGVFWDMQDTFLQDIERIEVISGPGATLWGANAVNGVINVITRSAASSNGTLLTGEAGDREQGIGARTGGALGANGNYRFYLKGREWDNTTRENGVAVRDAWERQQAGFRMDWRGEDQRFTFQGDAYTGESEHRGTFGTIAVPAVEVSGANLLGRWNRELSADSALQVQMYWSHSKRDEFVLFSPEEDIVDLEFQHSFAFSRQQLVWGGGYRYAEDDVAPGVFTAFIPASRSQDWQNIFAQDEIAVTDNLKAILGLKLEWNDYTGMEYLPSARLAWTPIPNQFLWTAVSRAVRAPSRFDRDVFFPQRPPFIIAGGPDFEAEVAEVLEVGYRGQLVDAVNLSLTLYHHDWSKLRSGTKLPLPTYLANDIEGKAWGAEAWANWQVANGWRLAAGVTTIEKELEFVPGGGDTAGVNNATLHNDPDYQWMLRSSMDIGDSVMFDLYWRRIAKLTVEPVPAYNELNARVAWTPLPQLEVAVTGRNLLDGDHAEFGARATRSKIDRSVLLGLRFSF
ncbi:MAG: TonB-dependent receptor [Pseudomonadota bacterium]